MKILIMAGGSGERFWPLSTKDRPKQLLPLLSEKTMIRETVDRLKGLLSIKDIYVATNSIQVENLSKELFDLPEDNIIIEPAFRDTAAAILYGSSYIAVRNDNPVIIVLASDHAIQDINAFHAAIIKASDIAKDSNKIVTLGIKPSYPETGYGYIKVNNNSILSVNENVTFFEKPNIEKAIEYINDGNFLWNSGMFIFSYKTLINEFSIHASQHITVLNSFINLISSHRNLDLANLTKEKFECFPKISIDFAIMEKSENIICLPTNFGWSDVGSFDSLWDYDKRIKKILFNSDKKITQIGSNDNFILLNDSKLELNLIDIHDTIIVQSGNQILLIHKNSSQKIKDLLKIKK